MKTALLTGASSGIGQAIKTELTHNEWRVITLGSTAERSSLDHYSIDLSDLEATVKLGKQLAHNLDHVDAFVHIAGIWHDDHQVFAAKNFASFTPQQIVATINVGLTSAMTLINALLPIMDTGTVIGVSGTFADGAKGWLPYYTSKRALEDFLLGLSQDQPKLNVFGISPADTATSAYAKFYPQYLSEAQSPEVIAGLTLKLLGGKTDYQSGDILEIRKGETQTAFHA